MSLKSGLALVLVVVFTTATGLLLSPLLRYYPMGGVLLIGLCLFLAFRWGLRGGNGLASLFLIIGLTIISAAGTIDFRLAATAVETLAKGLLVAVAVLGCCHWLFPEPRMRGAARGARPARAPGQQDGCAPRWSCCPPSCWR